MVSSIPMRGQEMTDDTVTLTVGGVIHPHEGSGVGHLAAGEIGHERVIHPHEGSGVRWRRLAGARLASHPSP